MTIQHMVQERIRNTYEIKHITCAGAHAFAFFLVVAGLDSNRVLRESNNLRGLMNVDYEQIEKDFR